MQNEKIDSNVTPPPPSKKSISNVGVRQGEVSYTTLYIIIWSKYFHA